MRKNECTKNYDITIVGGGLAGKLMLAVLINSSLFDENKLCWINTDNKNYEDVRVSFINYKNFITLKKLIQTIIQHTRPIYTIIKIYQKLSCTSRTSRDHENTRV